LCQQAEVLDVEPTYSGECEDQSLQKDRMSTNDTIEVTSFNMSDLEKIKSEAKHGRETINLETGVITHVLTGESPLPSNGGPQVIGIGSPNTDPVIRTFIIGNVQKPVRNEVYRWHCEFDHYKMYYVQYKAWFTSVEQKAHWIVCPGFDFRFEDRVSVNLYVVKMSEGQPFIPRLGMIHDEKERVMAKALVKLAHKAWPVSGRGQYQLTERGLAAPRQIVDWKGVDKWRVIACSMWWQWETSEVTWEARAADIRELCPGVKMTAKRLLRECAKDRLGLLT
jgi:hypothetical protein